MFGVMGTSAAFAQAAGAKAQKGSDNYLTFRGSQADPAIYQLTCTGEIRVESTKNGQPMVQTYSDLSHVEVSIQADPDTDVVIKGNITEIDFVKPYGTPYKAYTSIDASHCLELTALRVIGANNLNSILLSGLTKLTSFSCTNTALTLVDLEGLTELTSAQCSNCSSLETVICGNLNKLNRLDLIGTPALSDLDCE